MDLFSTLVVSLLPLSTHRIRLSKVEHSFLSEDAIGNLGSLEFSQSNRMPNPKDPSKILTTTTTTTFSMAKDQARTLCQQFLDARFIEAADGKHHEVYTLKGSIWRLTPKGIYILSQFCVRSGIQEKQVAKLVGDSLPQLIMLERDDVRDKVVTDRRTIGVIFRRFVGMNTPAVKMGINSADSDTLNEYGHKETFTGRAATDWLLNFCTTVDRRESIEIASLFVENGLMEEIQQDRVYSTQHPRENHFQPTTCAVYRVTMCGKDLVHKSLWRSTESKSISIFRSNAARDSNTQRLDEILSDPALRLLFREALRETHCEENLSFCMAVGDFIRSYQLITSLEQRKSSNAVPIDGMGGINEIMSQVYSIYSAFLAPGAPCELNLDHQVRNSIFTCITEMHPTTIASLNEVTALFRDAQNAVFQLMAAVCSPVTDFLVGETLKCFRIPYQNSF